MRPVRVGELLSLGFPPGSRSKGLAVVLSAYFDESYQGNGARHITAIAGYISSVRRWNQFSREWSERVLDAFKIKRFHMTDCEAGRGEFKGWPRERREEVKQVALPIIVKWTLQGGALAVVTKDFEELFDRLYLRHGLRKHALASIQDPYGWCFHGALQSSLRYAREDPLKRPVALYFDRKEKVIGQSGRNFDRYVKKHDPKQRFLKSYTSVSATEFLPLQAADVLAYELTKHTHDRLFDKEKPVRKELELLLSKENVWTGYDDRASLSPVLERGIREGRL